MVFEWSADDMQKRIDYLSRPIFVNRQTIPSPIIEADASREYFSTDINSDNESIRSLIIEKEPNRYDYSEEYYKSFGLAMRKVYREILSGKTSSDQELADNDNETLHQSDSCGTKIYNIEKNSRTLSINKEEYRKTANTSVTTYDRSEEDSNSNTNQILIVRADVHRNAETSNSSQSSVDEHILVNSSREKNNEKSTSATWEEIDIEMNRDTKESLKTTDTALTDACESSRQQQMEHNIVNITISSFPNTDDRKTANTAVSSYKSSEEDSLNIDQVVIADVHREAEISNSSQNSDTFDEQGYINRSREENSQKSTSAARVDTEVETKRDKEQSLKIANTSLIDETYESSKDQHIEHNIVNITISSSPNTDENRKTANTAVSSYESSEEDSLNINQVVIADVHREAEISNSSKNSDTFDEQGYINRSREENSQKSTSAARVDTEVETKRDKEQSLKIANTSLIDETYESSKDQHIEHNIVNITISSSPNTDENRKTANTAVSSYESSEEDSLNINQVVIADVHREAEISNSSQNSGTFEKHEHINTRKEGNNHNRESATGVNDDIEMMRGNRFATTLRVSNIIASPQNILSKEQMKVRRSVQMEMDNKIMSVDYSATVEEEFSSDIEYLQLSSSTPTRQVTKAPNSVHDSNKSARATTSSKALKHKISLDTTPVVLKKRKPHQVDEATPHQVHEDTQTDREIIIDEKTRDIILSYYYSARKLLLSSFKW